MAQPTTPPAQISDVRSEEMLLNMGPQHPSTHGVFRVVVRTDGEIVLDCEPHVGYLHRCFEKHCESVTVLQSVLYTDRLDYLMSMGNNLGYSIAFEKLWGDGQLVIPDRAVPLLLPRPREDPLHPRDDLRPTPQLQLHPSGRRRVRRRRQDGADGQ